MKLVRFHFDADLRPLLAREKRDRDFEHAFSGPQSVKHLIESLGIPHTETGELQADGKAIGPGYLVRHGDRIEVQAVARIDAGTEPRFILDGHLGRLTAHLRMLGLDCLYRHDYHDSELAAVSAGEERILLTRDRRLLMHKTITRGCLIRSLEPEGQLTQVVGRYTLVRWISPFQRCLRCNHPLEPVGKESVVDRLEPLTRLYFDEFHICPACDQVYWKGSHYERMQKIISGLH